jgi:RNA recognition motif-containing protein
VEHAERALRELDGWTFHGQTLTVRLMSQQQGLRQGLRHSSSGSQGRPAIDGRQVFCGGLGLHIDVESLRSFCSAAGSVSFATIFTDRETGRSKGAGKVEFHTTDMAQYAVDHLDGQMLDGRPVTVRLMSQDPASRPPNPSRGPPVIDGRQVFVGGLGPQVDASALRALFDEIGPDLNFKSLLW